MHRDNRAIFAGILLGWLCLIAMPLQAQTPDTTEHHALFTPDEIPWSDGPPSLPPGARFAVLEGDLSQEGYFALRLWLPDGYRIPPHWHPVYERVTVISGTFHLGMGEQVDDGATSTLPAGSFVTMPPEMRHFARVEGDTVLQLNSLGPWEIVYVNPADDPRRSPEEASQ
jgi:quercetin dioxygenase-like cupin family protein